MCANHLKFALFRSPGVYKLYLMFSQILVMSLFTGFIFFRVKEEPKQINMNLLRGSYFVSLLNMTLFNLGQLPLLMEERAVYYKQQGQHFYRPSTFLLAKIFGSMPFSVAEVAFLSRKWLAVAGCCYICTDCLTSYQFT